jgi:hypothetical protein
VLFMPSDTAVKGRRMAPSPSPPPLLLPYEVGSESPPLVTAETKERPTRVAGVAGCAARLLLPPETAAATAAAAPPLEPAAATAAAAAAPLVGGELPGGVRLAPVMLESSSMLNSVPSSSAMRLASLPVPVPAELSRKWVAAEAAQREVGEKPGEPEGRRSPSTEDMAPPPNSPSSYPSSSWSWPAEAAGARAWGLGLGLGLGLGGGRGKGLGNRLKSWGWHWHWHWRARIVRLGAQEQRGCLGARGKTA